MTKVFDVKKMLYGGLIFFVLLLFAGTRFRPHPQLLLGSLPIILRVLHHFPLVLPIRRPGSLPDRLGMVFRRRDVRPHHGLR